MVVLLPKTRHSWLTGPGALTRRWVLLVVLFLGTVSSVAAPPREAAEARQPRVDDSRAVLNGRFLLLNMHGFLFHDYPADFRENLAYARWMGAGVIRVFATDANRQRPWSGARLGHLIADLAPVLREHDVQLIVALTNNHQPVPGEVSASVGMMDGHFQHLLPFYADNWRQAYLPFARELITTVRDRGALDVIHAWELGNEIHSQQSPPVVMTFVADMVGEIRKVDRRTPIYPGSMGVNHLEPGAPHSAIARWLYCDAPLDAYTLHTYDWVSREQPGDMPIDWDLDFVTAAPCPNGRQLPVIVEELGTSRFLPGLYGADEEVRRLERELEQLRFVLGYPLVRGVGVWNGLSPRVIDKGYYDGHRGLTSYGPEGHGSGSCYDPAPLAAPGVRCQLETILRGLPTLP